MDSDACILCVLPPENKGIIFCRRNDFEVYKGNCLPGVASLLDGIARQIAEAEPLQPNDSSDQQTVSERDEDMEKQLVKAFTSQLVPLCLNSKNKKHVDPRVPKSFSEACNFPG